MSIKSDRWIRRMAERGMIEPFEAGQVRTAQRNDKQEKIISYGTSSYGYDVRCAHEFKIFTNINSTIVDPKDFDSKNFVDLQADVCIIPPNSFALARTVEYFRIPRNVLTICLGKCVTGDTRVVDAETGAYVPITEMRWGKETLALDRWEVKRARVSAFMLQGKRPVFQLTTRAGLRIRATANHPFRMLHGWTPLEQLRVGDRIAVARYIPVFGKTPIRDWEASLLGLMISEGQCNTPGHSPTFTSADPALVGLLEIAVDAGGLGAVTYNGRYGYRLVNHAGRGGIPKLNRAHGWLQGYGLNVGTNGKFVPQAIFMAPRESVRLFLQALFSGDGGLYHSGGGVFLEYYSNSRRLIEDVHHLLLRFGVFSLIREKTTAIGTRACRIQITDRDQIRRFAAEIGFVPGSVKQQRLQQEILPLISQPRARSNFDTFPNKLWSTLRAVAGETGMSLRALNIVPAVRQSVPHGSVAHLAEVSRDDYMTRLAAGPLWDVVEQIEPAGEEEVYDISVPVLHNFVANGLVVHNSTYARCFSADTRVALVDGTAPTLEEMARRSEAGALFWGYSIGPHSRVIVAMLDAPRLIGRDALVEIELDNGEVIRATPDHEFLLRDGLTLAAHALRPGQSLMPLYRGLVRGYEEVYQPLNGHLVATHRLADEWNLRHRVYEDAPSTHRHHIDAFRRLSEDAGWQQRFSDAQSKRAINDPNARARHSILMTEAWARDDGGRRRMQAEVARGVPAPRNHKVVAVRDVAGDHDVYCLTVPEAGNFALEAGVFVRNCGIIVNVTPLEPEWEGHVTLEFSNTTPLPAKIYANEGVAQMLFLESDEVCETSYKDRGGKYQGQKGVTLPKA